jgi:hypothetical protein
MIQGKNIYAVLVTLLGLLLMTTVRAADIETLLMPGEVIAGHAEYETECSKCHTRFSKRSQTRLCRDCHEDIDADIEAATGFHGRHKGIADQACKTCHTEHKGRSADIVQLNRATFDHRDTDFALQGGHATVSCASCHLPDKKFAEAGITCLDCHGDEDPHDGQLGEQCDDCHSPKAWADLDFDHDSTDFALRGKHRDASCKSCHLASSYKDTAAECNACHYLDDRHNGRNGTACGDCHSADKWSDTDFDHDKDTEFALRGGHRDVACEGCHTPALGTKQPESDCYACHRNDDQHRGRYGRKCETCHRERGWAKARFDHDRNTDFALEGAHSELTCAACHQGTITKQELATDCYSCHRSDDVHHGQEGKQCQRCHRASGWADKVIFEHDLTSFPLLGLHATAPCEECHLSAAFQDSERECIACHEQDDTHKASLGPDCAQCHNPNGWGVWIFDHDRQTEFKLDGKHKDLGCGACHYKPAKSGIELSARCQACHAHDDAHRGGFGRNCERCHSTKGFSDVEIQ